MTAKESRLANICFKLAEPERPPTARARSRSVLLRVTLCGVAIATVGVLAWGVMSTRSTATMSVETPPESTATADAEDTPRSDDNTSAALDRHAFADGVSPVAVQTAPASAQPDALNILLRGVLAAGPKGRAIVADAAGSEYVVSVGSRLGNDAVVREIQTDRLLVIQGAKEIVIRLQASKGATTEPATPESNAVITASGVPIDMAKLASEGVDSLTVEQKTAAIKSNLVIDDSAQASSPGSDTGSGAAPLGSTATHGAPGQRFIKNKQRQ